MNDSIKPGQVWLDTEGKRIQAHGGSLMYIDGTYYWYGENKEKTDGKNGIWHWGVRCYTSKDLYNWEDKGVIIEPELKEGSSLNPKSGMDRPHIIYNEKTKKYVCWLKIEEFNGKQCMTVLTADNILGPYTKVKEYVHPFGMSCGDYDLVIASDKKAYWYFERVHSEIICADLNDEYTDITGYYTTHLPRRCPPFVREAPAHFEHDGKHYLVTSGTTGYFPNPSEFAVSDTYHGEFKTIGKSHKGDKAQTSFFSQISSVFKVPGKKNLYIALADRWMPEYMHITYKQIKKVFELIYLKGKNEEGDKLLASYNCPDSLQLNTSVANYVWLPITFKHGKPQIRWYDEWKIEDFI